jgi:subtilisin family serine protease
MNLRKYASMLGVIVFILSLAPVSIAQNSNNNTRSRVISRDQQETAKAASLGCTVVRETKSLTALNCPVQVAQLLSLQEDIKAVALKQEMNPETESMAANQQIGAHTVHVNGNIGSGRKIAVLDTGYNYLHPELASSYLGGRDFVNNDNDPMDDEGHGSHVAGIITADGVNAQAKGVAPGAGIISGKVLDGNGSGYFSDIIAGIYWAVDGTDGIYGTSDDFNVDAINMSLGANVLYKGYCDTVFPDLTNAIKYAVSKNVPVVVAAGNSGNPGVSLPGCISYSTTVGAVDSKDRIASFSGRGGGVDITAPGVGIYSSVLGNSYASWSGTSMATPMISGVIALMKYAHPAYLHGQVEGALFSTAKDLGKLGKDKDYGWGRVQAVLAVQ